MKVLVVLVFIVIAIGLMLRYVRGLAAGSSPPFTTIDQIPSIVSTLERTGFDGSYVVFMFTLPGNNDDALANLQYSIENKRVGLDWVLEARQNVRDEAAVSEFIKRNGYTVSKVAQDPGYLRVEGKGIDDLGIKILRDFYHLTPDTKLELIVEGVVLG